MVTGVGAGSATFTFTQTSTGCSSNATSAVTVNANPTAPIVGAITQPSCATPTGSVALSGLPSSGSWTLTASPGGLTMTGSGTSATFSGLSASTTYTFTVSNSNNCTSSSSSNVVINAIPGAPTLDGTTSACIGATANVTPNSGGTWSSSNTAIATVTNAGLVTGVSAGSVTLTFTDGTSGCSNTLTFTVNANNTAGSAGSATLCLGSSVSITHTTTGATGIGVPSGLPAGVSASFSSGTITISGTPTSSGTFSYSIPLTGGCGSINATGTIAVDPKPSVSITGSNSICVGSTTQLSPTSGGTWTSSNTSVATVNNSGLVTGVGVGSATFTFTQTSTGCSSNATSAVTVNTNPIVDITGSSSICVGSTTQLSPTTGGTWVSSNTAVATVDNTGLVTGVGAGSATFTFTQTSTGCSSNATGTITVSALPSVNITGASTICVGQNTTLSPTTGGTWSSSNTSVATVNNSGLVTGVSAGSATFTFTQTSTGCSSNATSAVTVNALPSVSITGSSSICVGSTTQLSPTSGGTWASSNTSVATVNNSGLVTGVGAGSATFTFTQTSTGCSSNATGIITVSALPSVNITGASTICVGQNTTLSPTTGGTWASSNTSVATVNNSGLVTGVGAGSATFTFTQTSTGCSSNATSAVTVNALPSVSITGSNSICVGSTTQLSPTSGGTWTSSNTSVATVNNSGLVTGVGVGSATFTFTQTSTGCSSNATSAVTVNTNPIVDITGSSSICVGSTTQLSPTTGGTWVSSNTAVATVDNTGLVTGVGAGSATFTFTQTSTGCSSNATGTITVSALPSVNITGASTICVGQNTTLSPTTGGTWSSSNTSVATVNNSGLVTGVSAGSATFTFTQTSTGCSSNATSAVTVNANPSVSIIGSSSICVGSTTQLSPTTGGTWTSSNASVATVNNSGLVTGVSAGNTTFTFTNTATGCVSNATSAVTVNANPTAPIVGAITQPSCVTPTGSVALSGLPSSGSWTLTALPGGLTMTGSGTSATFSGLSASTTYTFTVSNSNNCTSSSSSNAVINAIPGAPVLGGTTAACVGATANVTPNSGGTWSSNNTAIATVTNAGVVTGVSAGSVTLTFIQTATGCSNTLTFTVNANPTAPIVGAITQPNCATPTGSVALSGLPSSGSWTLTASPGGLTMTGSGTSATFSGLSANTTYTFTASNSNNCTSSSSSNAVINAIPGAPVLGGTTAACVGATANVSPTSGGTWSSSNTSIATVTNAGVVTGISAGSVTLTFTDGTTGCSNTLTFTVNALPSVSITGSDSICIGQQTQLSPSTGGTWVSSNTAVATVNNSGLVTGISAGSATFTFTQTSTGCSSNASPVVTVLSIPTTPSGVDKDTICAGQSISISANVAPGMNVNWYTNSSGTGMPVSTSNPYTVSPTSTTTYYAFASNGFCNSDGSLAIEIAVLFPPAPPTGDTKDTICVGDTASLLVSLPTAGSYVEWYDNASGTGSPISNDNPLLVSPSTTTTYYAFATNGYCYSDGALAVTVYVLPIPTAPSGVDSISICLGDSVALSASAGGFGINWYNQIPGSILSTNNPWIVYPTSDTTFYAYANNGYCQSSDSLQVDIYVLPVPNTPSADTAHTICVGDSVVLQATLDPGASAQWYDNNGVLVSTQNPWVIYPTQNTSLNLYSFNGVCASSNYLQVNIAVFSVPPMPLTPADHILCQGDTLVLSVSNASGLMVDWYTMEDSLVSNQNPWIIIPTQDSVFYALLNNGVCTSQDTAFVSVDVYSNPMLALTINQPLCYDSLGAISSVVQSGTAPFNYQWSNGGISDDLTDLSAGTYVLTVTDSTGCQAIDTAHIIAPSPMNPSIQGLDSLCDNTAAWYFVQGTGISTYQWSTGQISDSVLYQGQNMEDPYLMVTVTNSNGCVEVDSVMIRELSSPQVNIVFDSSICSYQDLIFTANTNNQNSIYWYNGQTSPSITLPSDPMPDTVWVIVGNEHGCTDTAYTIPSVSILINPSPVADFDTTLNAEFTSLLSFVDSSSTDVINWAWDFGDGWSSSLQNPKHDYTSTGTYMAQLIVTNIYGCTDTTSKEIIIDDHLFIPNVFTPNGDGYNDLFVIPTAGIKDPYLVIRNRWGATLYETEGRNLYWDGRTNAGSSVSEGTYYYILYSKGVEQAIQTGFVTLLRD